MHVQFIDTQEKLTDICQKLADSEFLAIDTEFVRQKTYYPVLALMQVCDGQQIAIIDPLAIDDLSELMHLLYNESITKVFHSARQDLEIFYHLNQSLPQPLFDTQIAAALMGYGEQIGYAALVKQLIDVELDKSQTRTDWLKRPLTTKQINYAADDVRHLAKIYHIQKQQLTKQNRLTWLDDDFHFLAQNSTYAPSPNTMWLKIKGANKLKKQGLAILMHLTAWREEQAIKSNLPRRRVISDDLLFSLAMNPPQQLHDFEEFHQLSNKFIRKHDKTLLNLIQQGLNTPEKDCPSLPNYKKLNPQQEAIAHCLLAIVDLAAAQHQISPRSLCSRKDLDALVLGQRQLAILKGWRNELVGKQLLDFLSGHYQLAISSGKLSMINSSP